MHRILWKFDLKKEYEKWSKQPQDPDYPEPMTGWKLHAAEVFEDKVAVLLWENETAAPRYYYRVMRCFAAETGSWRVLDRQRFCREGYPVLGVFRNDEMMLFPEAGEDGETGGFYCITNDGSEPVLPRKITEIPLIERSENMMFLQAEGMLYLCELDEEITLSLGTEKIRFCCLCEMELEGDDVESKEYGKNEDADEEQANEERDDDGTEAVLREDPAQEETAAAPFDTSAQARLDELIGLKEAKERIRQIVAFAQLQKKARESGRRLNNICFNMAFTGNPGTAKTTVARLVAEIFREQGLLSKGELMEVGRADLVAKYEGQTAGKVKKLFEKAQGNLLFIDEAYSLVEGWDGEYGDEAIATIVQEMENNREDLIVIFAGYPDKMQDFLSRNPGLRSRVPYVVPFADYSGGELVEITKLEAKRRDFALAEDAEERIAEICRAAAETKDFGNGRFCRNLVEAAVMKHASSMAYGGAEFEAEHMFELSGADFQLPANLNPRKAVSSRRSIGFCA